MFDCCGKRSKKSKKPELKDAETQSEYELLAAVEEIRQVQTDAVEAKDPNDEGNIEKKPQANEELEKHAIDANKTENQAKKEENSSDETKDDNDQATRVTRDEDINDQANEVVIVDQPVAETKEKDKKRHSVTISDEAPVTIEINGYLRDDEDEDDDVDDENGLNSDEVFEPGVGPPIKLPKNMGKPLAKGQVHAALPRWFSEEEDAEVGGIQEPPNTPIGKDELALRRHRFFSDLLNAAQNASEHKVHFDPLGPSVAGAGGDAPHSQELEQLVSRLENVTSRLENVCQPVQEILRLNSPKAEHQEEQLEVVEEVAKLSNHVNHDNDKDQAMSVYGYQDVMQGPLAQYLAISQQLGGDIAEHSARVKNAFDHQLQYLIIASESKQPTQTEINNLIQPTAKCIQTIQEFREKNRGSPYFNHLSAISESIPALGWVAVSPTPGPYVKEMNDAGQFYTNRVLKDWKEKNKKHVDWVKAWVQTLTELQAYVKQHHTTGLVWAGKKAAPSAGVPPPPGPPPPPMMDMSAAMAELDLDNDRSALFAQINQGADITKSLKKVTADMQTHKNTTLRTGPAPFKTPAQAPCARGAAPAVDKPPVFAREGKKWLVEYQKGNHNLLVDGAEMNNVVYLFRCTDSTITVKGKINSITLDSCKKTSVVFDSLVSCVEFINCQSVQMQVLSKVPTISIDKTDGCQMYLSNESLNVEIVSSKSSEMNVLVPKPNGDYVEYPIPEQYKTTVVPGGLNTSIVESKG